MWHLIADEMEKLKQERQQELTVTRELQGKIDV